MKWSALNRVRRYGTEAGLELGKQVLAGLSRKRMHPATCPPLVSNVSLALFCCPLATP